MLFLLLTPAALAWKVPQDGDLNAVCKAAESGAVIEVDPGWSGSDTEMGCSRSAPVTIRSSDPSQLADVGGVSLGEGADGSRLEHLRMGTANHLQLSGVKDIEVLDLELSTLTTPGIWVKNSNLVVDGLVANYGSGERLVLLDNAGPEYSVTLKDCDITGNEGIESWGFSGGTTLNIEGCVFHGMDMRQSNNSPSVIDLSGDVVLTVVDSRFESIDGGDEGGAIRQSGGSMSISSSHFEDIATSQGGAIYSSGMDALVIKGSHFEANFATWGAAVYAWAPASTVIADSSFLYNTAGGETGGAAVYIGGATGDAHQVTVSGNNFCGNYAASSSFTAAHLRLHYGQQLVDRNVFRDGSSDPGDLVAGVYLVNSDHQPQLLNNDFIGGSEALGPLSNDAAGGLEARDNLFYDLELPGTLFGDLDTTGYNAWISVANPDPGPYDLADLSEPGFRNFDRDDCLSLPYLADISPLIDAGSPDRFDDDGSRVDIGAFAFGDHEGEDTGDTGDGEDRWAGAWISGGCSTGGGGGPWLLGLLALALTRRRWRPSPG